MSKILIIDDEALFRTRVEGMLQSRGYETVVASNGTEGIRLARLQPPDLIISDVNMDEGDGYAVLEALRGDPVTAAIPFILMTGIEEPAGMRRGMELGADDYLIKPFTPDALLGAVEARLKKRRAQREHEEQTKARLVAILEATTDLVAIVDAKTQNVLYLNRAGRIMAGVPDGADVRQFQIQKLHPAWAWEIIVRDATPVAVSDGVWTGETAFLQSVDREIPVSQLLLAHKSTDGSVEYFSTIARDITEQKRLEKERSHMEVQLRQALKLESIGQLAAGIAHEINTPTQYIGDNARFVQDGFRDVTTLFQVYDRLLSAAREGKVTSEIVAEIDAARKAADLEFLLTEIPKAISQSIEGVERVARIVRAMKEFSHPGTSEKTPIDLNHAVESTLTVCRNEWKYVAEMITEFDPALPPALVLPGEFNQAILNIVVNAAHAIADVVGGGSKGKGSIHVSTRRDGGWAEIRIRDTGTGIPEKARAKVFDPFFTTKGVGKGTGQGLAIAHSVVVEKHGGTISFETETGKGTTFIIRLPLTPTTPAEAKKAA
jgi:signal transduction histidine kinase/DNA-binding NarL/FixJ family response regulator